MLLAHFLELKDRVIHLVEKDNPTLNIDLLPIVKKNESLLVKSYQLNENDIHGVPLDLVDAVRVVKEFNDDKEDLLLLNAV